MFEWHKYFEKGCEFVDAPWQPLTAQTYAKIDEIDEIVNNWEVSIQYIVNTVNISYGLI